MPNLSTWDNGDGLVQRFGPLNVTARPTQHPQLFDYKVFQQPELYFTKNIIASEYPFYGFQGNTTVGGIDLIRLTDSPLLVDSTTKTTGTWNVRRTGPYIQLHNLSPAANDIVSIAEGYTAQTAGPTYTETFSTSTSVDFRRRMYFSGRIVMGAATASVNLLTTLGFSSQIGEAGSAVCDGIFFAFTGTTVTVSCASNTGVYPIDHVFTVSGMTTAGAPLLVEAMWEPESATFTSRVVDGSGTSQLKATSPNTSNPKVTTTSSVGLTFSHRATTTTQSFVGLDYVSLAVER